MSAIVLVCFLTRVSLVGVANPHSHPVMATDAGSGGDICSYINMYRIDRFGLESLWWRLSHGGGAQGVLVSSDFLCSPCRANCRTLIIFVLCNVVVLHVVVRLVVMRLGL
jgi:hypothetical protein